MDKRTCTVAGCDKTPRSRGPYCYGHYMKNWRYGTPEPSHPQRWTDHTGERFGLLVVVERIEVMWRCTCDCGNETLVRSGDLQRGTVATCGDRATHHRRDDAGYSAAHGRVHSEHGRAASHMCVDCGSPARHWSYNHDDPDERLSRTARIKGIAFSLDPMHYSPRCVPCHKRFDLDKINAAQLLPLAG